MSGMRSRVGYYPCLCCLDASAEVTRTEDKRRWRREVREELEVMEDEIADFYADRNSAPFFWDAYDAATEPFGYRYDFPLSDRY